MKINSFGVKKLAQNFLLVFSVLLSATIMTEKESFAQVNQTETVTFDGEVATSCTFGTVTNGTLGLTSSGFGLSTSASGGTVGSVPLNCNGGVAVQITKFESVALPSQSAAIASGTATVKAPDTSTLVSASLNGSSVVSSKYPSDGSVFQGNFTVEVTLDNNSTLIQSGRYQYVVDVTFTAP